MGRRAYGVGDDAEGFSDTPYDAAHFVLTSKPPLSTPDRNLVLSRPAGSCYNHPCRLAQRSRMAEMAVMTTSTTARWAKSVRSLTMMFIP
jgi:hypothetical protein